MASLLLVAATDQAVEPVRAEILPLIHDHGVDLEVVDPGRLHQQVGRDAAV